MKKSPWIRTIGTVVSSVIIVTIIYCLTKGWPLMISPKIENIEKVTVIENETGIVKEFTDRENIELAVKLVNFLNIVPFSTVSDTYDPIISISYSLKDGSEINLSANDTEVLLNGKRHQIKDPGVFINLSEGVFFFEENVSREQ